MRRLLIPTTFVLAAASLWWVQAPPRTPDAYGDVAAKTAETIAAQAETARLWSRAVRERRAFSTSAAVGLEDAERRARDAASTFFEHDARRGAEGVRTAFARIAGDASATLEELRIAAHNGDWRTVERADALLAQAARRLREFAAVAER